MPRTKNKQQEELMKLQEEYGYSPTAGCLPMVLNFVVIFGIIEVVYRPLTYILHLPAEVITAARRRRLHRRGLRPAERHHQRRRHRQLGRHGRAG